MSVEMIVFSLSLQHHCRKCGAVVCGACSSQKCVLPSQSSKPLRVCTVCYEELTKVRPPTLQGNVVAEINFRLSDKEPRFLIEKRWRNRV